MRERTAIALGVGLTGLLMLLLSMVVQPMGAIQIPETVGTLMASPYWNMASFSLTAIALVFMAVKR